MTPSVTNNLVKGPYGDRFIIVAVAAIATWYFTGQTFDNRYRLLRSLIQTEALPEFRSVDTLAVFAGHYIVVLASHFARQSSNQKSESREAIMASNPSAGGGS